MPSWIVECRNCRSKFTHSKIDNIGMSNYFLPLKPEFPADGAGGLMFFATKQAGVN